MMNPVIFELEMAVGYMANLPFRETLSESRTIGLLQLLDKCFITNNRSYLFYECYSETFELIALLESRGELEKYVSLFDKKLIKKYKKIDKLDLLRDVDLMCINNYNFSKYREKLIHSLLPCHQEVLAKCSEIYFRIGCRLDNYRKKILYINDEGEHESELISWLVFKIVNDHKSSGIENYINYAIDYRIIVTNFFLGEISTENIEVIYSYAVEDGFSTNKFVIQNESGNADVIKNFLNEAFAISEEFYIFAVGLVEKYQERHGITEMFEEQNLLSIKKTN